MKIDFVCVSEQKICLWSSRCLWHHPDKAETLRDAGARSCLRIHVLEVLITCTTQRCSSSYEANHPVYIKRLF